MMSSRSSFTAVQMCELFDLNHGCARELEGTDCVGY
jgi:hypothetical protein